MNLVDASIIFYLLGFSIGYVISQMRTGKRIFLLEQRVSSQERFNEVREKLYSKLADPEKFQAEMERSADLNEIREMRDAGRTTLPREDAGPPAVIHRPPLRGLKKGSWNPQPPRSPR